MDLPSSRLKILIINGPNLNLLGARQIDIYGSLNFEVYLKDLQSTFRDTTIDYFQSNHEGEIIDVIQKSKVNYNAIVINPGAYTHTSIGIRDAIIAINMPTVEVHISNIIEREAFRHQSLIRDACYFSIVGLGIIGYKMAILRISEILS